MTASPRARGLGAAVALLATVSLTSCVQVPREGPVVTARVANQDSQAGAVYNPPPPVPGAAPDEIVAGFLEAMTATPLRPGPAKAFLSIQAAGQWHPRQVIVFGGHTPPLGSRDVVVDLHRVDRIGASGRWRGPAPGHDARLHFPMTQENGEWRIASAPDALILQREFYEQNFTSQDTSQNTSLYFFDPTGRILVPEPVHVPQGSQLATALVKGLLRGVSRPLSGVDRSYFPPGLSVSLSVPVDRNVARVSLSGDPGPLSPQTTQMMLVQLAWTLRQDPSINAFTLSVADRTITDSTGLTRFPVEGREFDRYDPAANGANALTYAVRRGLLVSGPVTQLTKVGGPFGSQRLGIGPFAVSLDNLKVAAVVPGALQLGSVQTDDALGEKPPTTVLTGVGLLRPAWDAAKRLWEIQNDPAAGAQVVCYLDGHTHRLRVKGITGHEVRRFLVSRDGSRLIAVVRGHARDRIVASRLRYDADGRPTGGTRARVIPWSARGTDRIRDIGWTSPTTIAVLDQASPAQAELRILNVDGSARPGQVSPIQITGRVVGLTTSPGQQTPYAVQSTGSDSGKSSGLVDISPTETNRTVSIDGLYHLAYAG